MKCWKYHCNSDDVIPYPLPDCPLWLTFNLDSEIEESRINDPDRSVIAPVSKVPSTFDWTSHDTDNSSSLPCTIVEAEELVNTNNVELKLSICPIVKLFSILLTTFIEPFNSISILIDDAYILEDIFIEDNNSSIIPIFKIGSEDKEVIFIEDDTWVISPKVNSDIIFEFIEIDEDRISEIPITKLGSDIIDIKFIDPDKVSEIPIFNIAGVLVVFIEVEDKTSTIPIDNNEVIFELAYTEELI